MSAKEEHHFTFIGHLDSLLDGQLIRCLCPFFFGWFVLFYKGFF